MTEKFGDEDISYKRDYWKSIEERQDEIGISGIY